jgi:hypothetical protein
MAQVAAQKPLLQVWPEGQELEEEQGVQRVEGVGVVQRPD